GCRVREANTYAQQRFSGALLGMLACETPYFRRDACRGCPVGDCFASAAPRFFTVRDRARKPRYEVSAMPVEAEDGREALQVQRLSEVSARTQTEERLRFLGEVVASLDDAVLGLDPSSRVTALNPRCREMLGLDEAQAVGRRLAEVIRFAEDCGRRRLEQALARSRSARFEADLRAGPARVLCTVVSVAPVLDDERELIGMSVIIRDVTESRRVEEALRQSEKMSALGAFVAGLVHELNNPLSAIHGAAETLRRARLEGAQAAARAEEIFRHAGRRTCRRSGPAPPSCSRSWSTSSRTRAIRSSPRAAAGRSP
ncbi:MAG: PAS domain-containing protein, partial [Planctomycetes bacterium]|nr:PAS domain-containing protein [Planctomycetota bacterium]